MSVVNVDCINIRYLDSCNSPADHPQRRPDIFNWNFVVNYDKLCWFILLLFLPCSPCLCLSTYFYFSLCLSFSLTLSCTYREIKRKTEWKRKKNRGRCRNRLIDRDRESKEETVIKCISKVYHNWLQSFNWKYQY